ncbi:MAG TPA: HAD family hydrolase [Polyangiaceae bacterium]
MQRLRAVILDVDGTLVNSNDAHARSWVEALAEHDIAVEFAQVRLLIGMGGDKLLPQLCGVSAESTQGVQIATRRGELFRERYLPQLKPFPKTRELVTRLIAAGLRPAVASSAKEQELAQLLRIARVDDLMQGVSSASDAKHSKPDPDIVHAALQKLDMPAGAALMIGDTPYDVEAARKLGIGTIGLRCGGRSDSDLAGAIAIYDDPADLLAGFVDSPLGRH